jgi:hypothetical protein
MSTNIAPPTHPKDAFIKDWRSLPEGKRAEFADELVERLFGSGFSVLGKKEVELTVLALLEEAGALGTRTNHELSVALGITETRVRNLLHSARLRHGISDEEYLRSRLPAMLTKMSADVVKEKDGPERIRLVIEDALLQQALNARIKIAGGVPDTSFGKEITVVKLDDFTKVVFALIPVELQAAVKEQLGKNWKFKLEKMLKDTLGLAGKEAFKSQVAAGVTPVLVGAWNLSIAGADWLQHLQAILK